MSTSNAVSNVLGSFGGQLGLVNTGKEDEKCG